MLNSFIVAGEHVAGDRAYESTCLEEGRDEGAEAEVARLKRAGQTTADEADRGRLLPDDELHRYFTYRDVETESGPVKSITFEKATVAMEVLLKLGPRAPIGIDLHSGVELKRAHKECHNDSHRRRHSRNHADLDAHLHGRLLDHIVREGGTQLERLI